MEQELFFTGYCRVLDQSRMVEALTDDGRLTEADCLYGKCLYQASCPIARQLDALKG